MKKIIGFYRKCDILTMCGIVSAFFGILLVLREHYTNSILFLMISGLCDAFDGTLARKKNYSDQQKVYGAQLDSLSDVICFGVFPTIIAISVSQSLMSYVIGLFYLLCGTIRLAYFNMLDVTKTSKKGTFVGVPITTVSIIFPIIFVLTKLINFNLLKITLPITLIFLGLSFIIGIEYPKPDVPKIFKRFLNKYVVSLVIFPIFLLVGTDIVYKLNYSNIFDAFSSELSTVYHYFFPLILVFIIFFLIYLIIITITGNVKTSKIILIVIFSVLILVNDIKFNIMGNPIELSDINYLNPDNMSMMKNSSSSIGPWIYLSILKTLIFSCLASLTLLKNIDFKVRTKKRIISMISLSAFLAILIFVINNNTKSIINNVYKVKNDSFNSVAEVYNEIGFWPGFLYNNLSKLETQPDGYNRIDVLKALKNYENEEKNIWGKANVVFILSESFSDLTNIENIKFDKELMPNIKSYKDDDDKMVFDFISPTYGGASVNTEFEILTGASINFFSPGFIPYTQYYNNSNGKYAPNIIKEFNKNGYDTLYLTTWGETSYKSSYVYSLFEVDSKKYRDQLYGDSKGYYYSDAALMKDIYDELKTTSKDNYKFIMAASAQNHYPYEKNKYKNYDIKIVDSTLNEEGQTIMLNYAQGIYDADKELNNLYNMIQELDTPTIVVFYGDHLPYTIDSVGNDPYLSDKYFNTKNEALNLLRKYTTKAVILSNFDMKTENIEAMNASYLGAYVINNMDLDISNYFKFVADLSDDVPVFNRNTIEVDDKLLNYDGATKERDLLNNYKFVQYNALYDYDS